MKQMLDNTVRLSKDEESFLEEFLSFTGFELWNAGYSHRLQSNWSTENFRVCESGDPLHAEREYKTAQGAINYMIKKDQT